MKIRPLFSKYQRQILAFANTKIGKDYLGIKDNYKVVKLTPESFHLEKDKIYQASIYSRPHFINKIGLALTAIDIASELVDFRKLLKESEFIIPNYLGLCKPRAYLPSVYFASPETFYPNANPESTSVDGQVYRDGVNETWSQIRDAAAATAAADAYTEGSVAALICSATSNQFSFLARGIYLFDTSSITTSNKVDAATFSVRPYYLYDNIGSQAANVVSSAPASNTALATGDYDSLGTTNFSDNKTFASMSTSADATWTLNASGLSAVIVNGVSKLGLRLVCDIGNSAPTWGSGKYCDLNPRFSEYGSVRPKLVVTYSSATSLKKVDSIAYASIKKISGVAIASIKKVASVA